MTPAEHTMHHDAVKDPGKKHRHDIGSPDHGPLSDEPTTRNLQVLIGLWIAGSLALTAYAVVQAVFHASMS
jgi:hypothetical protein